MGGAFGMHGKDDICIYNFSRKTQREETTRKTKAYAEIYWNRSWINSVERCGLDSSGPG